MIIQSDFQSNIKLTVLGSWSSVVGQGMDLFNNDVIHGKALA